MEINPQPNTIHLERTDEVANAITDTVYTMLQRINDKKEQGVANFLISAEETYDDGHRHSSPMGFLYHPSKYHQDGVAYKVETARKVGAVYYLAHRTNMVVLDIMIQRCLHGEEFAHAQVQDYTSFIILPLGEKIAK